jgi:hypothetical protein
VNASDIVSASVPFLNQLSPAILLISVFAAGEALIEFLYRIFRR